MTYSGDMRIVIIGGGTGLSTLLRGLKDYTRSNSENGEDPIDLKSLTAVVTVTDDAGQTGELIDEFGIIPPGDIRESLVALADQEGLIQRLFLHKFESEGSLGGHSFGNLFLAALVQINDNNYLEAIQDASRVLRVEGNILPSTLERVRLCAGLEDGSEVAGEDQLNKRGNFTPIASVWLGSRDGCEVDTTPIKPDALPEAYNAIIEADIIILGPGGLYTSIVPNLLVEGISEAISRSSARTIYIANVMTQPKKTDDYTLIDHIAVLRKYGKFPIDYVLANNTPVSDSIRERYSAKGAGPVFFEAADSDDVNLVDFGNGEEVMVVEGSILCIRDIAREEEIQTISSELDRVKNKLVLRHDPDKLAASLVELLQQTER